MGRITHYQSGKNEAIPIDVTKIAEEEEALSPLYPKMQDIVDSLETGEPIEVDEDAVAQLEHGPDTSTTTIREFIDILGENPAIDYDEVLMNNPRAAPVEVTSPYEEKLVFELDGDSMEIKPIEPVDASIATNEWSRVRVEEFTPSTKMNDQIEIQRKVIFGLVVWNFALSIAAIYALL